MRKIFSYLCPALLALILAPAAAWSQNGLRIAYIDSQQIVAEAPGAREAQQSFDRDMARWQAELERLEDEIERLITDYQQQQVVLSPEARRQREDAIRQKQREYEQRARELEQQAGQRQAELVEPIMQQINAVIEDIRREGGYTLILDAASGAIVSADPALDITDQVLARLRQTASRP